MYSLAEAPARPSESTVRSAVATRGPQAMLELIGASVREVHTVFTSR